MAWRRGQTYSQDLRDRVLAADDESARELAERLGVSPSYVIKARQRRDREGRLTAGRRRSGPRPKLIDHYEAIDRHVHERPDATLEERRAWLLATHGVSASIATLWNTLRRLKIRRKKAPRSERTGTSGRRLCSHPVGLVALALRQTEADLPRRNLAEDEHGQGLRVGTARLTRGRPRAAWALAYDHVRRRPTA
jgi:transposase